ncbi:MULTISPECIES: hypothetical protein [Deefgea]|uniref:Uncharacterized protein n=1 Tax=Deefgea chitinilytica TaxID=570276 RepID=A0ABS2CBF9_9NEIS|nr:MULTISPECIES: hypothetical protein [Deefgea]MBM5571485.1 hypothetical protein [Deefgea chitinilytica]MBM9888718.1 hypothetical protein [Deefgea sp. CFH1-16]
MKKHAALMLLLPLAAWANELPPPKAQPIKAADSHAAPDTKAAKPTDSHGAKPVDGHAAPVPTAKTASKHAAPQQMTEPIKLLKPSAAPEPAAEAHSTPEVLKPTGQAMTRYVSPQFSAAKAATHRPVVQSKAPKASNKSHTSAATASYAMKPGIVRVLPAAQIPSSAILPPSKQMKWTEATREKAVVPNPKSNVVWGAGELEVQKGLDVAQPSVDAVVTPVAGRKIASPKYYSETNPETRWQYYSYP